MRAIYLLLGAFAKTDARLARMRVNFIPGNWIILGVLIYVATYFTWGAVDAFTNSSTPLAVSVAELAGDAPLQRYVRVSGEILPAVVYRHENGSSTEWWSPLLDTRSGNAILVKRSGNIDTSPTRAAEFTGMLRALDASARSRLTDDRVDRRYELVAGERPDEPRLASVLAVLSVVVCAGWMVVMARRDEIFQADGSFAAPLAVIVRDPILVRATGSFRLNRNTIRHFTDITAVLSYGNGSVLLQSKIATARNQVGIWSIAAAPGSLTQGQFGFLYFGWRRRYAYRFSYQDVVNGKVRWATIATDEAHRLMMAAAAAVA